MIKILFKYFFIILVINFLLLFISYFLLFAYDEGRIEKSFFVLASEVLMWGYRFPFQLGEIKSNTYVKNMILNQLFWASVLSLFIYMVKKLKKSVSHP